MERSSLHRLIALWAWMLFLLNGSGDAFGAHACPHHDAIAPVADAGMRGHGGMHGHGGHGPAAPGDASGHGACTCLGSCLTGTAAPLPRAGMLPVAFVATVRAAAPGADPPALPGRAPYVLPYATAPPVRLA